MSRRSGLAMNAVLRGLNGNLKGLGLRRIKCTIMWFMNLKVIVFLLFCIAMEINAIFDSVTGTLSVLCYIYSLAAEVMGIVFII